MGYSVSVNPVVVFAATCAESGCRWPGETSERQAVAERAAAEHSQCHSTAWMDYSDLVDAQRLPAEGSADHCPGWFPGVHCRHAKPMAVEGAGWRGGTPCCFCELVPAVHP